MADYTKMTNAELSALLKERSLPHTGKKAEMVSRLQDHEQTSKPSPAAATATAASEPSQPAAAALAAGGQGQPPNPLAVPNQAPAIDPSTTTDLTTGTPADAATTPAAPTAPAAADAPKPDSKPFADQLRLAPTTLEDELAKRAARAAKFGGVAEAAVADDDAAKKLARAKKFGAGAEDGAAAATRLDAALPEARPRRGTKRASEGPPAAAEDFEDPGLKRRRGPAPTAKAKGKTNGGNGSWMSEEDRKKAEARKAKFGGR